MEKSTSKLIILTTLYNSEKWIDKCIQSIKDQTVDNYKCFVLDDISTDSSVESARKAIGEDPRFVLVQNTKKYYQTGNYDQIIQSEQVNDNDICVEVDGDDWLPDNEVFHRILDAYSDEETWLAFGQFKYADGRPGFAKQGSVAQCRTSVFTMSHIRTWKAFLWRNIKTEDLYTHTGWYSDGGGDLFFMTPMYEMATEKHTKFMNEVNYVYNDENPLNDHKRSANPQHEHAHYARQKPPYGSLNFAYQLLTPMRFDLIPKFLYAVYRESKLQTNFATDLYKEHLRIWNGFKEYDNPDKNTFEKFKECFDNLIDSMKKKGFDKNCSVPTTPEGYLLNGAHRTAAAYVTNSTLRTLKTQDPSAGQVDCGSQFFKSLGLDKKYLDFMALEYIKLKSSTKIITLHPARDPKKEEAVTNLIYSTVPVIYDSVLPLDKTAFTRFVSQMYLGESWLSTPQDPIAGAKIKANLCWGASPVRVVLIEENDLEKVTSLKAAIRSIYNIDKSSVHINDNYQETLRLGRIAYNPNSISFLSHGNPDFSRKLNTELDTYKRTIEGNNLNSDLFCVTGSAVMSLFGLRECADLDYLHYNPNHIMKGSSYISSHENELSKYPMHKDDILFNPNNHFYWNNIKFATLGVVKSLKAHRGEEKDLVDVRLIKSSNA
tara:strand:+ start:1114 stop:3087 length:1974 start_codon:yes stop_codon:yes gene_type:complete